jgi:hypothetical protein
VPWVPRKGVKWGCPVGKEALLHLPPISVVLEGQELEAKIRTFKSGSRGWKLFKEFVVMIDNVPCKVTARANFVVTGSKEVMLGDQTT